jgi:hypothetical protein
MKSVLLKSNSAVSQMSLKCLFLPPAYTKMKCQGIGTPIPSLFAFYIVTRWESPLQGHLGHGENKNYLVF